MSNIKISEFPYENKSGFTAGDLLLLVNYQLPSGTTVNTTITDLKDYVLSGVTDFIPIKYAALKSLYDTSALTTTHYVITDYQTIYDQPDFDGTGLPKSSVNTLSGDIEPLVILATSESTFSNTVYSLLYPQDTLEYDITFDVTEVMNQPAKGRITLRVDELDNMTNYDHRAVLFKRYESSPGSGIFNESWDNGNSYIDTIPTFDVGCYNIEIHNVYNPSGYGGWGFILPNNIFGIGCRDIVTGNDFYNNTFGNTCYSITFGENCHDNIVGNSSFFNDIGNDFLINRIGGDFKNNHITNGFRYNQIGDSFKDNHISSGFRENVISNNFQRNTIEFDFKNPGIVIGVNFSSNTIGNFFQDNIAIGNNFQNNNIGNNFIGNDIGDDFINWFLQNNFTGSTIPSSSQNYTVIETLVDGFVTSDKGYLKNTNIITESGGTLTVNGNLDVTGNTTSNGLTANTISASTYQNLPIDPDTYVTGFTYSDNTLVIKQNNGQPDLSQTINSVTGWTVNGNLNVTGNTVLNNVTASTVNNVKYIDFDITQTGTTSLPGRMFWDVNNRTVSLGMLSGVTQQIGLEQYFLVENQTSGTLDDGAVVRAAGVNGPDGTIAIDYMIADGTLPAYLTLGVLTQTLLSGQTGYVTSFGLVRGIDTTGAPYGETWVDGDILYVSPTILGGYTKVRPIVPNQDILVAIVMEASVKGTIFVRPDVYRPFKDPQLITVAKANADFTSIKDAVDSITSSSSSNRYIIEVGPGEFNEGEIDLTSKPFVSIVGSSIQTTLVTPTGSTQHIFKLGQTNEISFMSLSGAGTNYSAIYCYDIGDFAQAHKISIYDCDTGIWVESDTQDTKFYGEYIDINGEFTNGVKVIANNNYLSLANLENYYVFQGGTGDTYGNYATGSGASLNLTSSSLEGNGATGSTSTLSRDGAFYNLSATDVSGWGYGHRIENVGGSSSFEFNGVTYTNNIWDISVEQSSASGVFAGISNHQKITTISDNVYWSFLDANDGEFDITRKASVTFTDGSHTDFTTLVFEGGPMGVMSGGQITVISAFTINTEAGYGYLTKSDGSGIVRRIDWVDTTLTLTSNSDLYVFINENGILGSSGSRPSSVFNIIMGRVVTNSTTVEFIDLSPVNAEHMANRYGSLLRNAIGPIYSTGSIVTENVAPFHLNVSQGEYYYASNEFMPSGGTDITFTQYYRNGLGGWVTSATTLVNNTSYDGNGSLSALTTSYYTKHTLYLVGEGSYEKYFLVLGQNEYSTLVQAEDALLPTPPTFFTDAVTQVANIYIQQGTTGITQIEDIRPVIGFKAGGVNASSVHGNLLGLTADDHLQYLRVDGNRAMSGNLNMGGNNIVSAGTVNGVTVQTHATRHQFGGSDPVGTVTPSANAIPFADVNGKLDSWITPITISGGTGIVTGGTYPNFTLVNSSPDQTVTISGGTGIVTGGTYPNFTLVNSAPDQTVTISGGTGITTGGTYPNFTLVNSAPDQTVVLNNGTAISTSGTYPNFTISNTAPDQTVTISGGTGITTGGTYPNFTLVNSAPDQTVTISGGTGITTGGTYPNFTLVNSAPDQTVVLNNGTGISATGTYPNFTISNTAPDQTVTISGGTGITTGGTYPNFTLVNSAPDQTVVVNAGTGISVSGTYPNFTITYTGTSGGAGSSIFTASTTTTGSSITTVQTITGITDNATSIIEVYVKAYQSSATNWGVWKRTLSVTKVSNVVTIQEENADVDKQSSGLSANSLSFSVSGGDILVRITGIAATTINWTSAYEIVI